MIQLEPRKYINFTVYHPNHPDNTISVEAFEKRGAQIKGRKILSSMGVIDREEHWSKLKVNE